MSSLYLRGTSVWVSFSDKFKTRRRIPTHFVLDKALLRDGKIVWPSHILDWKKQFDARLALGYWRIEDTTGEKIRVSELLEEFIAGYGSNRAPRTQILYRQAVEKFKEFFSDTPIGSVTEQDIAGWRDWMIKKYKGNDQTAAKHIRQISPIFAWAVAKGMLLRSPLTRYVKFTPKPRPIVPFSEKDLQKLFVSLGRPAADQFRFLLLSGFRLGESCALKWDDVDRKQKLIRLWNQKESRWDYFPMDKLLAKFMRELSSEYSPFVFRYQNIHTLSQLMRRRKKTLKLNGVLKLHTLRTNFISSLINAGLTESEVMHLARHRSIVTTHKYYTAFDQKKMREALGRSRGN